MNSRFGSVLYLVLVMGLGLIAGLGGCSTPTAPETNSSGVTEEQRVQAVIDRWMQVTGGRKRLERFVNISAGLLIETTDGEPDSHNLVGFADGRFLDEFKVNGKSVATTGYDGKHGWQVNSEAGLCMLPERCYSPTWWPAVLDAMKLGQLFPVRRLLPGATVNGTVCTVIGLKSEEGATEQRWFFDR